MPGSTIRPRALVTALLLPCLATPATATQDNTALTAGIASLIATHNAATPVSLFGDPLSSVIAEGVVFSSNLGLKFVPAVLDQPPDRRLQPNSADRCSYDFTLPQSAHLFSDLFGLVKTSGGNLLTGVPEDWGALGTPTIAHANSEVLLTVIGPHIDIADTPRQVRMPAGAHNLTWRADTLFDPGFDLALPAAMLAYSGYSKLKSAKTLPAATAGDVSKATREYGAFKRAGVWMIDKLKLGVQTCKEKCLPFAVKTGTTYIADALTDFEQIGATHERRQGFTVYDVHPPTLEIGTPTRVIEASDFGGVFLQRVNAELRADITAEDACDRPVSLSHDAPTLLPIGETTLTWTVRDRGPTNSNGDVHTVTGTQTIRVQDTQAPILVPPAGKVIEVPNGTASLSRDDVNLGAPMVVDLADPAPTIESSAPASFPVDTRTAVVWSATDHGFPQANTATAEQLITIKRAGTNTAPTVSNRSGQTLTSRPIDFVLRGTDNDLLDGRVDPLAFEIVARPEHGEFIAPLYPFFIEDYRTAPGGPYGEDFYLAGNKPNWLYDNVCTVPPFNSMPYNDRISLDWVYRPRFVHVTDDGTLFMIDSYWKCGASNAQAYDRISKWDADGNYLGQIDYGGTTDAFVMDQDGYLYVLNKQGAGSSTTLSLQQIDPSFSGSYRGDWWRFTFADTGDDPVSNEQFSYARVDSERGLVYVNDRRRVFVYDVRDQLANDQADSTNGMDERYLGALNGGAQFLSTGSQSWGSSWTGFAMEVDRDGNLYVADTASHRIHKFNASYFDADGSFVLGDYVGWMGRCTGSTNKACDTERLASKGYSCTDATCVVDDNDLGGEEIGQFYSPAYLAIDPNDILYVADYGNSRIQRFAPDGTFAGEAVSSGTGINRGDNPGFVLGNMGSPKAVSVNSTQFFVVDTDESFVHVFETSPFKDITDESVTVTYVSDFDFHSATDRFRYRASDGLAHSNIGTVSIQVDRNYRPPLAFDDDASTPEDEPVTIELVADDPDGIAGVDFNGLDTLTYVIVDPPEYGTLTGSGATRTYTPNPDYYGTDRFTFRVNDGRDDSNVARVALTVEPVEDGPTAMAVNLPARIGEGFPVVLEGHYRDDGAALHDVTVAWGDATTETNGDFVDPDGPDGPLPAELQGIKLIEAPAREGDGIALGQHVYSGTGAHALQLCLRDDNGRESCIQRAFAVERLAGLQLEVTAEAEQIKDETARVTVTLTNMLPENFAGLTADSVTFSQSVDDTLKVARFVSRPSGCNAPGGRLVCGVGSLAPGAQVTAVVEVERKAAAFDDVDGYFTVSASTGTPSLRDSYTQVAAINILADPAKVDSDGDGVPDQTETTHGLDPNNPADGALDKDVDGLSNADEYAAGTDIGNPDSDGDGVPDGSDPLPLSSVNPGALVPTLQLLLD